MFFKIVAISKKNYLINGQKIEKTCYFGLYYKSFKTEIFCDRIKKLIKKLLP